MFGKKFNVKQLIGDYHDLCLKSDVQILTDVFENFRKTGEEYDNLDPACYFSCPGFAWDAMLSNNLHGWAMSQPLPTGRFKWLKEDKGDDIFKNKEGK